MKRSIKLTIDDEDGLPAILEAFRVLRYSSRVQEFVVDDESSASRAMTLEEIRGQCVAIMARDYLDSIRVKPTNGKPAESEKAT